MITGLNENIKKQLIYIIFFLAVSIVINYLTLFLQFPYSSRVDPAGRAWMKNILEKTVESALVPENFKPVNRAIINRMLGELDPHSHYMLDGEYEESMQDYWGFYSGIGASIRRINGVLIITRILDNSPASAAGIKLGDSIYTINGEKIAEKKESQITGYLIGDIGSKIILGVKRRKQEELLYFTLARERVKLPSVKYSFIITGTTGYIKLSRFSANTMSEVSQAMKSLIKQGMTRLIIDLRSNPGGYLDVAVALSDKFLPKERVITSVKRRIYHRLLRENWKEENLDKLSQFSSKTVVHRSKNSKKKWLMPLILLVDKYSASSSEIFSGAIQDNDRGLIIGERTYGKALIQQTIEFGDGSAMALTIGRYFTPSGRSIQKSYRVKDKGSKAAGMNDPGYKTVNGRVLHSHGGIEPDISVPGFEIKPDFLSMAWNRKLVFAFAYEIHSQEKPETKKQSDAEIRINQTDRLEAFLRESGVRFSSREFAKCRPMTNQLLRYEMKRISHGEQAAYRSFIANDNAVNKALTSFRDANTILEISSKHSFSLIKKEKNGI